MRVLVAEDDVRMASMLRRGLTEDGYTVDVVTDGTDAIWRATEHDYDVIVLDVMLPGADGFTVCRTLRENERWAPVLMLTARTEIADRVRGLDSGADDYLAKPFSFSELSARLRALVRRGVRPRPSVLRVDSLTLDPGSKQVHRGEEPIELSPREFALLELLMRHPGMVLTRTRILDHVWDFAYDGGSNVVDQYIAYLRRKVDRPFGLDQLQTVRGQGYRLLEHARPLGNRSE